jgi:hypothetical protein
MDDRKTFTCAFIMTALLLALGVTPAVSKSRLFTTLQDASLSRADVERIEQGYYESLLERGGRTSAGGSAKPLPITAHHDNAAFDAGPLTVAVSDVREFVLKPNLDTVVRGGRWSTNALGMRDQNYEKAKPSHTIRIAFIGDSIGSGWGVNDGQGFEPTLERALDRRSRAARGPHVEVLNFAVPGHAPGQRWEDFTRAGGWDMGPDVVLYEATPADPGWDERRLRSLLARGLGHDAPVYKAVLQRAGIQPGESVEHYKRRLRPYRTEILGEVYRTIAAESRAHHATSVWALIPRVGKPIDESEKNQLITLAKEAGFSVILDLTDVYDGLDAAALAIGPADFHPNAEGHKRIARRLEAMLEGEPRLAHFWSSAWARGEAQR